MGGHATRRPTALTRAATWCKVRAPIFSHFYQDDSDQRTIADRATRHTTHIPATCGRSASIRNGKSRVSLSDAIRIAGRAYFDPAFRLVRRSSVCVRGKVTAGQTLTERRSCTADSLSPLSSPDDVFMTDKWPCAPSHRSTPFSN
jgi:hypothetical protein